MKEYGLYHQSLLSNRAGWVHVQSLLGSPVQAPSLPNITCKVGSIVMRGGPGLIFFLDRKAHTSQFKALEL